MHFRLHVCCVLAFLCAGLVVEVVGKLDWDGKGDYKKVRKKVSFCKCPCGLFTHLHTRDAQVLQMERVEEKQAMRRQDSIKRDQGWV